MSTADDVKDAEDGRPAWRRRLIARRPRDPAIHAALHARLLDWLMQRPESGIGAYWPIRGEFDPLPALRLWQQADAPRRQIALPVMDQTRRTLAFHAWRPGCRMADGGWGILQPRGTPALAPALLLVPCVGYASGGLRLGYGGGFYDRTLAALHPRPATLGLAFAEARVPGLMREPHDVPLDAILTESGLLSFQ